MPIEILFEGDGFSISAIVTPPLDNNVYLIRCTATNRSVVVDAASDPDAITELVDGTDIQAVVTTHGHWDHHGAIPAVTGILDVPFMLHPADAEIAGKAPDVPLSAGPFPIGNVLARIIHTPGHTPGSVCLALDGVVITGDTLFPGGPGATRFDHSSFDDIVNSIESELFRLPDETVVLPGHGASTTIGTERSQLPEWKARGW